MFVVDHPERTVRDDDAVGGSEALFYPAGEVHTLLDKDYWIGAGFLGGLDLLQHIFGITGSAVVISSEYHVRFSVGSSAGMPSAALSLYSLSAWASVPSAA